MHLFPELPGYKSPADYPLDPARMGRPAGPAAIAKPRWWRIIIKPAPAKERETKKKQKAKKKCPQPDSNPLSSQVDKKSLGQLN